MPATSLASAPRPAPPAEGAPLSSPRLARERAPSGWGLWPEALRARLRKAWLTVVHRFRAGWLYRQSFRGPVPDRILFHPDDPRARRLEQADALMRGRFRLGGQRLDIREGSIFDAALPGDAFAAALHGFEWLRDLDGAGEPARLFAMRLTQHWLNRHGRYDPIAWRPETIAERFLNLFAHGRFFLLNSDLVWRSRLFVSLRNQAIVLSRSFEEAPDGLPKLKAASALVLAGTCLGEPRHVSSGLKRLASEIGRQILPDGGHVARAPETLLEAYRVLAMVQQGLDFAHAGVSRPLRGALDRMAPMLRFFRMGDGALCMFHGGGEGDAQALKTLLERDETLGRPLGHAPYSGYQRLAAGRALVLFDVAPPPAGVLSTAAHAGCLAFEMSSGAHRLIVNCGFAAGESGLWASALRGTAAHSTLTIGETSSAAILGGRYGRLLGPRLIEGPVRVQTGRTEGREGIAAVANHDGYLAPFGILHERRLMLSPRGSSLTGADRLFPEGPQRSGRKPPRIPFAIRFHIHPDVRVSLSQDGGSVVLKLPNGEGWRFRSGGIPLALEESVYFGGGSPRRAEQIVVHCEWRGEAVECAWLFEQLG